MADIRSFELTGTVLQVTGLKGSNCCIVNHGTDVVYVNRNQMLSKNADGVVAINPGESVVYPDAGNTLWFRGNGNIGLISSDYTVNFFRNSP